MDKINVKLGEDSYDILIGQNLLSKLGKFIHELGYFSKVAIITDINVASLYLEKLDGIISKSRLNTCSLVLPEGESSKSWKNLEAVVEWILKEKLDRDALVIAFGGGVIGDLVGLSASISRRGIALVQIPTTLLAQVDSSVGGKTAINSKFGKNLIGTFYQPKMVISDSKLLSSLNDRQFLSGMSEVIKYGLILDRKFFQWIEMSLKKIANRDPDTIGELIARSCEIKAQIVHEDEKENGIRALLNLGHTFGHALEAYAGFSQKLLHGEAVSIGTVIAFKFSKFLGICSEECIGRLVKVYSQLGMLSLMEEMPMKMPSSKTLLKFMMQDKKVNKGNLVFILPEKIGKCMVNDMVPNRTIKEFLDYICA